MTFLGISLHKGFLSTSFFFPNLPPLLRPPPQTFFVFICSLTKIFLSVILHLCPPTAFPAHLFFLFFSFSPLPYFFSLLTPFFSFRTVPTVKYCCRALPRKPFRKEGWKVQKSIPSTYICKGTSTDIIYTVCIQYHIYIYTYKHFTLRIV